MITGQTDNKFNLHFPGTLTFQRELLINRRRGYLVNEEAANETDDTLMIDLNIYKLPVGVKPSGDLKDGPNGSRVMHSSEENSEFNMKNDTQLSINTLFDESTDASLKAPIDLNSTASSRQNGVYPDVAKRSGRLSARAASMLVCSISLCAELI